VVFYDDGDSDRAVVTFDGNDTSWDLVEIDITPYLVVGLNDINLTHTALSDALSAIHFHVNLPAGAAPPDPDTPEPMSLLLLASGLLLLRRSR
jgi:hypothetical protein